MPAMLILCAVLAFPAGAAPALPPEMDAVRALTGDEDAFVEAVRASDRRYKAEAQSMAERARALDPELHAERVAELRAAHAQRIEAVRALYEFALYHYPNNPRLRTYFGELHLDWLGDPQRAVLEWRRAIGEDERFATAHANLGMYYASRRQLRMGLEHLDRALELEPDNAAFLYNLVQVYLNARDEVMDARGWRPARLYRRLMQASRKAAELEPGDFELQQDYAVNHFAADDFGVEADWVAAAAAWRRARVLARSMNEVFYTWLNEARAWIWSNRGDDRARACLEQALRIWPENAAARILLDGLRSGVEF